MFYNHFIQIFALVKWYLKSFRYYLFKVLQGVVNIGLKLNNLIEKLISYYINKVVAELMLIAYSYCDRM